MSPVALAELDAATRRRVLEQIPNVDGGTALATVQADALTVPGESCQTLSPTAFTDPMLMTNEELADMVIAGFQKLRPYIPYIITLNQRFRDGKRDSANHLKEPIRECHSWSEFCDNQLHRTPSAVNKAIRELKSGDTNRKPKPALAEPDWVYQPSPDQDEATELYQMMVDLPEWRASRGDGATASAIYYGTSYTRDGGVGRNGEIPEIPSLLKIYADKISAIVGMPMNYIQCHRYGPADEVSPHLDPEGMIVPMLVVGQERTFRFGDEILGKNGKPFPRMASQQSMQQGTHVPEEELLLQHGSLLVFNGGRSFHSMLPADNDPHFNPNGFDWRISILFRWTTPAMREFGTRDPVAHGSLEQYEQAKREYRERIGWNAPQPEPSERSLESVLDKLVHRIALEPYGYYAAKFAKYPEQHATDLAIIEQAKLQIWERIVEIGHAKLNVCGNIDKSA